MSLLTYLDPNAIKDASIEGIKIKNGAISSSKIDETVASKSYVDAQVKTVDNVKNAVEALKSGKVTKNSKGEIKQYCEADLIN